MNADARPDAPARDPRAADRPPPERAAWDASRGLLALAAVVVVLAGVGAFWPPVAEVVADAAPRGLPRAASRPPPTPHALADGGREAAPGVIRADGPQVQSVAVAVATPRIVRHRDPDGDLTPDLADWVNEGDLPTMAEVIRRLQAAGVYTGLGAFSPPGTRPPLVGLAVPEDFPLPDGFVRHHQVTDDGQRIEPILMFAPNHPVRDAGGQAIPMPADRLVPPALAPAGLPIRRITLPAPVPDRPRGD